MVNVIASFRLTPQFEDMIAELEQMGIERDAILALPLQTKMDRELLQDKQEILFETAPIAGMILMLLGTIYGYVLEWGPIIWAIIGLVFGMMLGFIIDKIRLKRKSKHDESEVRDGTEVFLLIHCENKVQASLVKELLWKHAPIGVTTYGGVNGDK